MNDANERSIETPPPIRPRRLHGGKAVLLPRPHHAWESRVVLNPASVLRNTAEGIPETWELSDTEIRRTREASAVCVMLYRAQGNRRERDGHAPSAIGFALFTPMLEPIHRRSEPILLPDEPFDNLGVEDPRCTRVGDTYFLYYTGYSKAEPENRIRICLATSEDLCTWKKHGPVRGDLDAYPNKNAALLPEPVNGKWLLLHRPMEGPNAMTIHWAVADAPEGPWNDSGRLVPSHSYREFRESWIGAGGPPIWLGQKQFLMIYHQGHFTRDGQREYDLAAALLDFDRPDPIVGRIEPMMRPTGRSEQHADPDLGVENVLFTCSNYVWRDELIIPYAGADSRIFGASVPLSKLCRLLEKGGNAS